MVTSSTETEYARLISDFVVGAYEQVLDEHDWESLVGVIEVVLNPDQETYIINKTVAEGGDVTAGITFPVGGEIQFTHDRGVEAMVYETVGDDDGQPICFLPPEEWRYTRDRRGRLETSDWPEFFTVKAQLDEVNTDRMLLQVYPLPSVERNWRAYFWRPSPDLKSDGTTDNDAILVPDRPVFALALMYAYNERGEEIGEPGNLAERRYIQALQAAIEKEIRPYQHANRYDWYRD